MKSGLTFANSKLFSKNLSLPSLSDTEKVETYGMVVSTFSVLNKYRKERFFEESFLLADVSPGIVLGMPFLTMSNADVNFQAWDLQWRSYTTREVLPTTR